MPIVYGPLVGRWGSRRLVRLGLILMLAWLPMLAPAIGVKSALALMLVEWMVVPLAVDAVAHLHGARSRRAGGADAYGVGYGVTQHTAWAIGAAHRACARRVRVRSRGVPSFAHHLVGRRDRRHAPAGKGTIQRLAPEGDRDETCQSRGLAGRVCHDARTPGSMPTSAPTRKTHVEFSGMLGRMAEMLGGKSAREGLTSTVAVKGDRKATLSEASGQIIDLSGGEGLRPRHQEEELPRNHVRRAPKPRMEEARKKTAENARARNGTRSRSPTRAREADGDRLHRQEHRREEGDQRLRHAPGR